MRLEEFCVGKILIRELRVELAVVGWLWLKFWNRLTKTFSPGHLSGKLHCVTLISVRWFNPMATENSTLNNIGSVFFSTQNSSSSRELRLVKNKYGSVGSKRAWGMSLETGEEQHFKLVCFSWALSRFIVFAELVKVAENYVRKSDDAVGLF